MKRISGEAEKIAGNLFKRLIEAGWIKVPPGYKLVPIDASPEQLLAVHRWDECSSCQCHIDVAEIYSDMIDAAPTVVFDGKI